jgi:hypothetical protein
MLTVLSPSPRAIGGLATWPDAEASPKYHELSPVARRRKDPSGPIGDLK